MINPFPLDLSARQWVNKTLESLSLEQLVGQLLIPRVVYGAPRVAKSLEACGDLVNILHVGGFYVAGTSAMDQMDLMGQLRSQSQTPLFFCSDFEAGVGNVWPAEATRFPFPLAMAAAGDADAVRQMGMYTGLEARTCGINWSLTPVCDVNVNPLNPIVNVRGFGDDPVEVSEYVRAFIKGLQSKCVLACAKHFPGQGNTETDSHRELATIMSDERHLEDVDLVPFLTAIQSGVGSIMPGHIFVPHLTVNEGKVPATFSHNMLTDLLRNRMGFKGLIISDSMKMQTISRHYSPGESAVRAIKAGVDCILLSPDPYAAHQSILNAVKKKELSGERIRESVHRILRAKAWLGLHEEEPSDPEMTSMNLRQPETLNLARTLTQAAITVVKDRDKILPLEDLRFKRVFHLALIYSDGRWTPDYVDPITNGLLTRFGDVHRELIFTRLRSKWVSSFIPSARGKSPEILERQYGFSEERKKIVLEKAGEADITVVSVHVRTFGYLGRPGLIVEHISLLEDLDRIDKPLVVVAMGSPYLLGDISELPCLVAAYDWSTTMAESIPLALTGEIPLKGRLPVRIPNLSSRRSLQEEA